MFPLPECEKMKQRVSKAEKQATEMERSHQEVQQENIKAVAKAVESQQELDKVNRKASEREEQVTELERRLHGMLL